MKASAKSKTTTCVTLSVVKRVKGKEAYCAESIVSVDDENFVKTRHIYPSYEGEYINEIQLVNQIEFDIIYDKLGRKILLKK